MARRDEVLAANPMPRLTHRRRRRRAGTVTTAEQRKAIKPLTVPQLEAVLEAARARARGTSCSSRSPIPACGPRRPWRSAGRTSTGGRRRST
jgi:hypothetical protein